MLGGKKGAAGEGVLGVPDGGIAAGDMAQDHRDEIVGYGAGDAHRNIGLMAVVGAYEDAEAKSGKVGGVFMPVVQ